MLMSQWDKDDWLDVGEVCCWPAPASAHWFFRLPVVRHIRYAILRERVNQHETLYRGIGLIPTGYDGWVLWGVARGWV